MIKCFIFDWDGVLSKGGNCFAAQLLSQKYSLNKEEFYRYIDTEENQYLDGNTPCEHYYSDCANKFGIPEQEIERILETIDVWPEMKELVRGLKEQGITTVLLSNQIKSRSDIIRKSNDLSIFDQIFFSNEIGLAKPDPAIYYYVLERMDLKPEECLFIDDREKNLAPAKKIGIHALLCTDHTKIDVQLKDILS